MSEHFTDQQLVDKVKEGDKKAFNLLVLKYQNRVTNIVARYIKNNGDVADVTQEAFIKAYRALPNFRGDSAFYTWLYRIAVNSAKNYLVSQSRKPPASDVDAQEAEFYEGAEALHEIREDAPSIITPHIRVRRALPRRERPRDVCRAQTVFPLRSDRCMCITTGSLHEAAQPHPHFVILAVPANAVSIRAGDGGRLQLHSTRRDSNRPSDSIQFNSIH